MVIIGIAELAPAALDLADGHSNFNAFLGCSLASLFFGGALIISNYTYKKAITIKQTFLLTTLSWLCLSLFAAFPLYLSDLNLSFTDAFFESISGITTTGSTVIVGLDQVSRGILLWRSITQWIGGIGIIAFAILILPFLSIGGMQLFQTESSDKSDKVMAKTHDLVMSLLKIYVFLTFICTLTFYILGMSFFDAINHAMTTIPTGGFSTHDASFGHFQNASLDYAASFFMLLGGLPFVLYVKLIFQGRTDLLRDEQCRVFLAMLLAIVIILTLWLWFTSGLPITTSLRYVVFNVISIITTTGYATTDYTLWGSFAVVSFFFITFLGSCAGSTAGGIKTMRLIIVGRIVQRQIKTLIFPRGTFTIRYQGCPIDTKVTIAVMSFLGVYIASNAFLTLALTLLGLDFETAISGAATALANVGPGIGPIIGPVGNFSTLPDAAKWLLCAGMLFGRLEIMTILVLFRPEYWRS